MATNLQLDDELVNEADRLGAHTNKKEAVSKALEEYVGHLRRLEIIDIFGTVDYDPDYDYKKQRKRK